MTELHMLNPSIERIKEAMVKEYHKIAKNLIKRDSTRLVWLRLAVEYHKRYRPNMPLKKFMSKIGCKPKHIEPVILPTNSKISQVFEKIKRSTNCRVIQLSLF